MPRNKNFFLARRLKKFLHETACKLTKIKEINQILHNNTNANQGSNNGRTIPLENANTGGNDQLVYMEIFTVLYCWSLWWWLALVA